MKARILKINGGEAYSVKVGDVIEVKPTKTPINIIADYMGVGCGNDNRFPLFKKEDLDFNIDN